MDYLKGSELVADIQKFFGVRKVRDKTNPSSKEYIVENRFWYHLFVFSTALGDETFYSAFIPFWFWNVDGAVGRRMVLVWTIIMYVGQGIKDILRWPRPGPPAFRLQHKWALEYGMPSTHAMVGVSIPFSIILYTMDRYQYNVPLGVCAAVVWCTLICISRLYLGMHSVLDVIVGLALAIVLMVPLVPIVDFLDSYLLTNPISPILLLVSSILVIVYYPNSGKWTPTRGDTSMILGVCVGIHVGAWLNYQTGLMQATTKHLAAPYVIMWPSYHMLFRMLLRTIIGFGCVLLTKELFRHLTYQVLCAVLGVDADDLKKSENTLQNKHKTFVDLSCKYVYCGMIGFNTLYMLPQLFRALGIERPTFFTEI
ncbi:unnamed protein product [Callosobruchus maculatus]|uniref:Phosphatidic acid phosphatase type 2/haloperoxidase domain-containing protein n=1 Tax=Callosobruchus maculatus TaxID=64391 RepID=A0A653CS02_CALMS|nr:unnamed protein product [Callosobruchus maculatus]